MSQVDDLLRNAERYSNVFTAGDLPTPPALNLAIVTCMDSRIDVFSVLGLHLGEAHIIRNAGGIVTDDVLRSLALSQALLGTRDVMVIQHTGCGLNGHDEDIRGKVADATGATLEGPLHAFTDVDASVREQVQRLRDAEPLTLCTSARGFVYEVETGRLREVT